MLAEIDFGITLLVKSYLENIYLLGVLRDRAGSGDSFTLALCVLTMKFQGDYLLADAISYKSRVRSVHEIEKMPMDLHGSSKKIAQ